jgi:GTP cyclohydrolase I
MGNDIALSSNPHGIDASLIELGVRQILKGLGQDLEREGLKGTPARVAKAYQEIFKGVLLTNQQIADMLDVCFEEGFQGDSGMVVESNISFFSTCEHHLLPMYDMVAHVGYIPNGKVIGLSKIARIVELVSARPSLQERIGQDIVDVLHKITGADSIMVVIEGKHACMTMRGIKSVNAVTKTATIKGLFTESEVRNEFYSIINR